MRFIKKLLPVFLPLLPLCVYAQTIGGFFNRANQILTGYVIPFVMSLCIMAFLYGVVSFIAAGDDSEKRKKSKFFIIWGIIALVFMVSFWALVWVLIRTFFGGSVPTPGNWPPTAFP